MTTHATSFQADALVLHARHGQGTTLLTDRDTTVVRFAHGIEQVFTKELTQVASVSEALTMGQMAPSLEVALRVQAEVITTVNAAWGVFTRSRISLLPHQLWVCHRALRTWPMRLLIADDVGMGKTIEAGLLLWPLLASRKVQRVLIFCPAKLVVQWQMRLKRMFDIRAATYHTDLDTDRTDFWGIHQIVIASLPTLRADRKGRHDRLLDAPAWDMVVIDEAHHLNADEATGKTLGFELVEKLNKAGKVVSCVLFTGTPHRGKNFGFWSLLSLLDSETFGPKRNEGRMLQALPKFLIRNAKQKATDMKGQRLFKPVVQYPETFTYSPPEEAFYELMSHFILAGKAYATSLSGNEGGRVMLVLIALQKLASSSIAAVVSALHTRIKRLGAEAAKSKSELASIEESDGDEIQQALHDWLRDEKQARLRLMEDEGRYLDDLIAAADLVTSETRIVRIIEVIKQRFSKEPVLLFTEYKRTQALVISALISEFGQGSVGFMNGDNRLEGVRLNDGRLIQLAGRREDMCDAFNEGRIRFLVSTEAGGEGIDLGRFEDGYLRHSDTRRLCLSTHGVHKPLLGAVGRGRNHARTRAAFGHPFGNGQGNEGAAKPEDRREDQQAVQIEPGALFVEDALHAEQTQGDAEDNYDGQVGHQKQSNAFHSGLDLVKYQPSVDSMSSCGACGWSRCCSAS